MEPVTVLCMVLIILVVAISIMVGIIIDLTKERRKLKDRIKELENVTVKYMDDAYRRY